MLLVNKDLYMVNNLMRSMKHVVTAETKKYFEYSRVTNIATCKVPDCKQELKGYLTFNMKRHLITRHKEIAESIGLVENGVGDDTFSRSMYADTSQMEDDDVELANAFEINIPKNLLHQDVRQYYDIKDNGSMAACKISDCTTILTGVVTINMKRHIINQHNEVAVAHNWSSYDEMAGTSFQRNYDVKPAKKIKLQDDSDNEVELIKIEDDSSSNASSELTVQMDTIKLAQYPNKATSTLHQRVRKYFIYSRQNFTSTCQVYGCAKVLKGYLTANLKRHLVARHKNISKLIGLIAVSESSSSMNASSEELNVDENVATAASKHDISDEVKSYFDHSPLGDASYCKVEGCTEVLKGYKSLKQHLISCHEDLAESLNLSNLFDDVDICDRIEVYFDEKNFFTGCVEMFTVHGMPLNTINLRGFRRIIEPITKALGIKLDIENAVSKIRDAADKIRLVIMHELRLKLISIKIDVAASGGRCVLCIHSQIIHNQIIVTRALGTIELLKRHTIDSLRAELEEIWKSYNVDNSQIYSCTTDVAINTVNMSEHFSSNNLMFESNDDDYFDYDIEPFFEGSDDMAVQLVQSSLAKITTSNRCPSNTLQLIAKDVIDKNEDSLDTVRIFIKKLNSTFNSYKIKGKLPPFDEQSKWITTYRMLKTLKDYMDCYKLKTNEPMWTFVENFLAAIDPIAVCAQKVEENNMTNGDFYKCWFECRMKLMNIKDNPFTEQLLQSMCKRKKNLFDNDAFRAAIYLDPRFNFLRSTFISTEDKEMAKEHMLNTWERLKIYQPSKVRETISPASSTIVLVEKDELDLFIEQECAAAAVSEKILNVDMLENLNKISLNARLPSSTNILKYWENKEHDEPNLYLLAKVVLATPSANILGRNAHNALNLLLMHNDKRMKPDILKNTLLVRLNENLIGKVLLED